MFAEFILFNNESTNKISVLFLLRLTRANKKKGIPIVCRITVNGKRCPEFYTQVYVPNVSDFDQIQETTNNKVSDKILQKIRTDLEVLVSHYQIKGEFVDANDFYLAYNPNAKKNLGKKVPKMLFEVYDKFLELSKKKLDAGMIEECSYKKQITFKNNLVKYFESLGKKDFEISKIQKIDYENIKIFMIKDLKFSNNHTLKNLTAYKNLFEFAVDSEFVKINPFKNCTMPKDKPKKIKLTLSELQKFKEKIFPNQRLQEVADCFVFCCYTGLSFKDLGRFKIIQEAGREVIHIKRKKTDVETYIPIFEPAKNILTKYDYKLPVKTNQKHNGYLKEIQNILGFDKILTTHIARRTFGRIMLNQQNVSYETTSKMMGHDKLETLKEYYADIELDRILYDTSHIK